jgi:hypothetical protein
MKDKAWDYESLNAFLAAPRTYAPGTRMGYAGMASPTQRADVIAYLRSLDANRDGKVSFNEYVQWILAEHRTKKPQKKMRLVVSCFGC